MKISFREALVEAQKNCMRKDERVFTFGLDVADHKRIFGSTEGLVEEFGERRCFSTPLSEDAMTGVALGAAINGLRPIHVHIRADFLLLGMNQLLNMIAPMTYLSYGKLKVPLVIRAVIGRGWGQGAQHSKTLHSFYSHIPGLKVVLPATPQDAYSLLVSSVESENPVIFLEHRWLYDVEGSVDTKKIVRLGESETLRKGSDITIVAVSWMAVEALKAAEILEKQGVSAEVINLRSVSPLDKETMINSVKRTGRLLVADYDWVPFGLGAECSALVSYACFSELKLPVERVGFKFTPCPTTRCLENEFYPNALKIVRKVEKMFQMKEVDLSGENFFDYENKFLGPF